MKLGRPPTGQQPREDSFVVSQLPPPPDPALHEDWAVLVGWSHHRPSDAAAQRTFLTQALEELLRGPPRAGREERSGARHLGQACSFEYELLPRQNRGDPRDQPNRARAAAEEEWGRPSHNLRRGGKLYPLDQSSDSTWRTTIKGPVDVLAKKADSARPIANESVRAGLDSRRLYARSGVLSRKFCHKTAWGRVLTGWCSR